MTQSTYDPSGAVTFDLARGRVGMEKAPDMILAPREALHKLCEAAGPEAAQTFGRVMGRLMGQRVIDGTPDFAKASPEQFIDRAHVEFALVGLGVVTLERWGNALLFVVDDAPLPTSVVAAILTGYMQAVTARKVACVPIMADKKRARFFATDPSLAGTLISWLKQGASWGEVLLRLHNSSNARGDA